MKKFVPTVALLTLVLPLSPVWSRHKQTDTGDTTTTTQVTTSVAPADAVKNQPPITVKINGNDVQVPAGTAIRLELQELIVSNKAQVGQPVHYLVAQNVVANGQVVIRAGAPAIGKILGRMGTGGNGKSGKLDFDAESVTAVDGTQVPLIFHYTKHARNTSGAMKVLSRSLNPFAKGGKAKVRKGYQYDAVIGVAAPEKEETTTTETAPSPTQDKGNSQPEQEAK